MLHVINAYEPGYQSVPKTLEKSLIFEFFFSSNCECLEAKVKAS